jgi:hypothetical protein
MLVVDYTETVSPRPPRLYRISTNSRPSRADSRSGHVCFATDFCGATKFRDVPRGDTADAIRPDYTRVGTPWVDVDYIGKGRSAMLANWREFIVLAIFVLLFGAAMIANVSDGSLSHVRGAWLTQATR